jgi:GNAT superfamily N-acetyltransferase
MEETESGMSSIGIGLPTKRTNYTLPMQFQIRVAVDADIPAIREVIQASVRELQAGDYTPAQIEGALATVFTVDSRLIADGTYLLALSGDRVAGCGGWSYRKTLYGGDQQLETIESSVLDPATEAAKIRAIFVHPDYARMRLGSLILKAAEEAAVAAGFRRLEMGSTLTGVPLYSLKGYRETVRTAVPVGSGEEIEIVRMTKVIEPDNPLR